MTVKVDHADGAPVRVGAAQRGEGRGVVATQGDDAWDGVAGVVGFAGGGHLVSFVELFEGDCVVLFQWVSG